MRSLLFVIALAACGGGRTQIEIGPPPPAVTTGTLSGPLCKNTTCTCRTGAEDAGVPDGTRKRFELRLKSARELWLKLPGDTMLYKSAETPTACFYVDLPTGSHPVELRASNDSGVAAAIGVSELGAKTKSAYETFRFSCGTGGACSFEELDGKKAEYAAVKNHTHDPCGSTKVKEVVWDTGRSPDRLVPSNLALRFVLQVYKFEPDKPHGDPACGAGDNKRRRGAPEGGEPDASEPASPPAP